MQKTLLVIGPEPPPETGMELATQALVQELHRANIRVARVDTADAVDILGNRGKWTLRNIGVAVGHVFAALRLSRRRDVGAVYVPIAQEFPALLRDIAFLLAARVARVPAIVHLHGGAFAAFYASRSRPVRALLRQTIGRAALGIVLTDNLRPALECVIPSERIAVVPNGIDVLSTPRDRVAGDTIEVLFLSSLFRWKGPLVFIEAFARARTRYPLLRATVAGDWPGDDVQDDALQLADELGVADAITFTGPVDREQKRDLLDAAHIFCFASLVPEGQPLVIIEAMAAKLPVVAPAWPGIADTVVDGETGFLVAEPSPEALAALLVQLAEDEHARSRLGAAGRARYDRLYTRRAFGERMIEVIGPFLGSGQPHEKASREGG